jgi:pimeloyl-ACP methyl ester carboxylesterase
MMISKRALVCLLMVVAALDALRPARASAIGICEQSSLRVATAANLAPNQTVSGTLCEPNGWGTGPREVDVLVHGATYSRWYWDWPVDYPRYSYVARTVGAHRAAFYYDNLGSGASSRPPSETLTQEVGAYVLHQVVHWLRSSGKYDEVNTIGHSLGSVAVIKEVGTYQDVDRAVITGVAGSVGSGVLGVMTSLYPAAFDPAFPGLLDLGYITTRPGTRGSDFCSSSADPQVIAYDEAHKDIASSVQLGESFTAIAPPLSAASSIIAPVLVIIGQEDGQLCGGLLLDCADQEQLQTQEEQRYPNAASVTALSVPDTGHDLALHPSADLSFALIDEWIEAH